MIRKSWLLFVVVVGTWAMPGSAKDTFMVPMSDGTSLATDVHYPPLGRGPWPVILARTPYNKDAESLIPFYRLSGYAVVVQDLRGRFASEGTDRVFIDDGWGVPWDRNFGGYNAPQRDGIETVRWIRRQDWCDGRVGTTGASALGIVQNLLAGVSGNDVDCQLIQVAATDPFSQICYMGGVWRESLVEGWLEGQGSEHMLPFYEDRPTIDRVWSHINFERRIDRVEQPGYHVGGWYDIFIEGTINDFVLRQQEGGDGARGQQKMVIGPWVHYIGMGAPGELVYPGASGFGGAYDLVGSDLQWFGHWLKGEDNGIMDLPPIAYYQMGPVGDDGPWNEWRSAWSWPPEATTRHFYLQAEGGLTDSPAQELDSSTGYAFDPEDPVPTIGGANLNIEMGPMDQSSVEDRSDVLLFRTPVLEESIETAGRVTVDLWVESSALDTDFTAKLIDVYPDGRNMLVCDAAARARFRNGFEAEELLVPGEVVPVTIDLWPTAITFGAGHRIGLDISSSNWPRFDVNPNTGEPIHRHTRTEVAHNSVHHSADYPSRLTLQVTAVHPAP